MNGYLRKRDRRKPERRKGPCTTWQLVVDSGLDEHGRRQQLFRSFRGTKGNAEAALRRLVSAVECGDVVVDTGVTLEVWVDQWLETKRNANKAPGTIRSYRNLLRQHITPRVGHIRLSDLKPIRLQKLFEDISRCGRLSKKHEGEPLSPTTVRRIHQALSACLKRAVKMKLLGRNPAFDIELPDVLHKEQRALTPHEASRLVNAARGTRLFLPILIAVCTGMRRGEVLGLRWGDVDFSQRFVNIARQIVSRDGVQEPKRRSRRRLLLASLIIKELHEHRREQSRIKAIIGPAYDDQDYLFATEVGDAWNPDGISTLYTSIVKRAEIGHVRFHDLRHSAASILAAAGVPIPEISRILGHTNVAFTAKTYTHALNDGNTKAAQVMDDAFGGLHINRAQESSDPAGELRRRESPWQ